MSWRTCAHRDARTWHVCKHWRCLVWCRVQHPSLLMKDDVDPQDDIWHNGTTHHIHGRQHSCTSDKTPRLVSSFVLHQCSVTSYTKKVTCLGIVHKKMHKKQSLLTSIMMSPCVKAILATRGLKMTAAIAFYQRTTHIFSSYFFLEENLTLLRSHPYFPQRCIHHPQHNPLILPSYLSYMILLITSNPFTDCPPFSLTPLLSSLPFMHRLHSPL